MHFVSTNKLTSCCNASPNNLIFQCSSEDLEVASEVANDLINTYLKHHANMNAMDSTDHEVIQKLDCSYPERICFICFSHLHLIVFKLSK